MSESIEEMKERLYPILKKDAQHCVECYRDRLLELTDQTADEAEKESEDKEGVVCIPVSMAYALVNVCNFVERLDMYGK